MKVDDVRHGTYAGSTAHYKAGEKPCPPCADARRKFHTRYTKERGLGYVRRISVSHGNIWQQIDALYSGGYSYGQLAAALGMRPSRLYKIHTAGPGGRIYVDTWRHLNGRLPHVQPAPTQLGTLRRLQALHALGWPIKHIMDMAGHTPEIGKRALRGEQMNYSSATRWSIAAVYDRLSMTLPPTDVPKGVLAAMTRAKKRSAAMGWVSPMGWNDIDRDAAPSLGGVDREMDSVAIDRVLSGDVVPTTRAERVEIIRRWLASGRSVSALERQTGWQVSRYYRRTDAA